MCLDKDAYRTRQFESKNPLFPQDETPADLTTPVHRAALEALEREFSDLLTRAAA
jgi:hypothetical protein